MKDIYEELIHNGSILEEMNNCPQCKSQPVLCDNGKMRPIINKNGQYTGMDITRGSLFWVNCEKCRISTSIFDNPQKAIEKWNKGVYNFSRCVR